MSAPPASLPGCLLTPRGGRPTECHGLDDFHERIDIDLAALINDFEGEKAFPERLHVASAPPVLSVVVREVDIPGHPEYRQLPFLFLGNRRWRHRRNPSLFLVIFFFILNIFEPVIPEEGDGFVDARLCNVECQELVSDGVRELVFDPRRIVKLQDENGEESDDEERHQEDDALLCRVRTVIFIHETSFKKNDK